MSIERKLIGTVDASSGPAVYVEDVFNTWLYTGNGSSQTINNGIDLATKGGLVWIKSRSNSSSHQIYDTVRGATKQLRISSNGEQTRANGLTSFTASGYVLGSDGNYEINTLDYTYASWVFRKQPKFFDIVTWTGDGTDNRLIAHNLGTLPGMILAKDKTIGSPANWITWHKSLGNMTNSVYLDATNASSQNYMFSSTNLTATSTTFPVSASGGFVCPNQSGQTYVAYLFADSNSGGFGAAGTDSVVACGSWLGGNTSVNLGWEPQFILVKNTSVSTGTIGNWFVIDNMRGFSQTSALDLRPNLSNAEDSYWNGVLVPTATGFDITATITYGTYIYLAIRRGPMKTPTDATKVYNAVPTSGTSTNSRKITGYGFAPDLIWMQNRDNYPTNPRVFDKLRGVGATLNPNTTSAEAIQTQYGLSSFDMDGYTQGTEDGSGFNFSGSTWIFWGMRRAPGFFDVVCYTGTGSANTVAHNLGVAPELMIVKSRNNAVSWIVGCQYIAANEILFLNNSNAVAQNPQFGNTRPTASSFTVSPDGYGGTNASGYTYVAYLFATCPGVSKVFSFTGNGSSQTINCGFASGARFVLIKRTDAAGDWWVYDSARGIVSAADPALALNSTAAEVTSADAIDPDSSGFIVNQETTCNVNVNNATYIGLAIA